MSRNTEPCDPIVLLKQMSLSPCAFTSSFGMVASASAGSVMWVGKGCRGVFCCAGRFVSCGSKGERGRQHCGCNTTKSCAPVTRAWPDQREHGVSDHDASGVAPTGSGATRMAGRGMRAPSQKSTLTGGFASSGIRAAATSIARRKRVAPTSSRRPWESTS